MAKLTKKQTQELKDIQDYITKLEKFINDNIGMAYEVKNHPNGFNYEIINPELAEPNNHTALSSRYIGVYSKNGSAFIFATKAKNRLNSFIDKHTTDKPKFKCGHCEQSYKTEQELDDCLWTHV